MEPDNYLPPSQWGTAIALAEHERATRERSLRGPYRMFVPSEDQRLKAAILADRLEEQDCLADAELVRRLAGL